MNLYYILSLKWSPGMDGHAVWWRTDAKGYTVDLNQAGLYSEETINSDRSYYDNGNDTQAWRKENAEAHAKQLGRVCSFNALRIADEVSKNKSEQDEHGNPLPEVVP